MRKNKIASLFALISVAALGFGCTPEARQDLDQAGDKIGSATEKSAQGTAEAMDRAGDKVAEGAKETARMADEAVGGAVQKVEAGAEQIGAAATITPKVKGALVADKSVDASTLNVTVDEKSKSVMIEGNQPTAAKKDQVTSIAQRALNDMGSDASGWTIKNNVKVP
jgi:hypothetical protein